MLDDDVRVVVVDDTHDVADMLSVALQIDGYAVRVAYDATEALVAIEEHRPHCVLLDINMPGIDGCELSKRLREKHGDDIVLVAITGSDNQDQRVADTFARVDHYLRKPVDPMAMRKVLPPIRRPS
jgi:DNA-binding response OmpR family regulator